MQVNETALREVKVLLSVAHVNIVKLLHHFEDNGQHCLVFEYVPFTLLQLIENRSLRYERIVHLTKQLVTGLEYLHERKVSQLSLLIKPQCVADVWCPLLLLL